MQAELEFPSRCAKSTKITKSFACLICTNNHRAAGVEVRDFRQFGAHAQPAISIRHAPITRQRLYTVYTYVESQRSTNDKATFAEYRTSTELIIHSAR